MGSVHVAFNPAGTRAYVADQFGNALSVLDASSHTVLATIPLGDGGFNLGVSPDGGSVYVTTASGYVRVISTASNTVVASMTVGAAANGVAFSPDGGTVYISSRDAGTVTAFSTSDNHQVKVYGIGGRVQRIAVSPDGKTLYAANEDMGVAVVNLSNGQVTTVTGVSTAYGLGLTPGGTQLWVTSPGTGTLTIIDRGTLTISKTVNFGSTVVPRNVAFSADGSQGVVTDGNGGVIFLDQTGAVTRTLALDGEPYGVAISSAGQLFVARVLADVVSGMMLGDAGFSTSINVETGAAVINCTSGTQWMGSVHVAFNPAGNQAYVTDQFGNAVSVLDAVSHTLVATIPIGDGGFNLGVAPDGGRVYATTAGGHVVVIATANDQIVDSAQVGSAANGVAFSPDGSTVYISSRDAGTVTAFRASDMQLLNTYAIGGTPQRIAVSHDGKTLYAANEAHGVDVVDLTSGAVTAVSGLSTGYGLGQTPDGAELWVTSPREGKVYIVDPGAQSVSVTINLGPNVVPRNVAFSADGKVGVVTDGNGSVIFFR
jgi:YVTN family beta-propeller protein